jgi:hypothetical protein
MSLFSWLFSGNAPRLPAESSGLSSMELTRPAGKRADGAKAVGDNAQPASRKGERLAQRELLYSVVRDSMVRAGVLSSSYKFKVLSLDSRGRQFMVMVDLAADYSGNTLQLAEIEALIAQSAKSRHQIVVTAVYWRRNEHVAIGHPTRASQRPASSQPATLDSGPAPIDSKPATLSSGSTAGAATAPQSPSSYDPILPAEVAAFKRALSAGPASAAAAAAMAGAVPPAADPQAQGDHSASARGFDGSVRHGPQSYTLLTGFEDTELPDARVAALSGSQYGDLN